MESKFQSDYNITIGVEFNSKVIQIDDQPIKLQIWDTVLLILIPSRDRSVSNLSLDSTIGQQQVP